MPELPEVETLRRSLEPHLLGRTVIKATLRRRDIAESFRNSRPARTTPKDLFEGATIRKLTRRGKQLAIIAESGAVICVHLGMTGQLLMRSPSAHAEGVAESARPGVVFPPHTHALWQLNQGQLLFRDPRRFGGLWTFDSLDTLHQLRWNNLGPDALSITPDQLAAAVSKSRRHIKAALLDQQALAGVGNIYADEALFASQISPRRLASRLMPDELESLATAIRDVLERSIQTRGSTLRDYRDANGEAGSSQLSLAVYGRGGEPCTHCGTKLRQGQVAQRTTVWCPQCQR